MLTSAAHYFLTLFTGPFSESLTNSASFPDDDPTAFELLIQWCYTGKLPSLTRQAQDAVFNVEVTKFCTVRLKLCALADKYGMVLLHNLAVDSLVRWLRAAVEGEGVMGLEWSVFEGWCRFVYEHSSEGSPLRKFVTRYFNYAIRSQKEEDENQMEETGTKRAGSGYSIDNLQTLANDIPDLTKDLFALMRVQAFAPKSSSGCAPWDCHPCDFHIHPSSSKPHYSASSARSANTEIHVACPTSLIPALDTNWANAVAKIQYFLQDSTLKGASVVYVSQITIELGLTKDAVMTAVMELIKGEVVRWISGSWALELVMPRGEEEVVEELEVKGKGKKMVTSEAPDFGAREREVDIESESEAEEDRMDLYSSR